MAYCLWMSVLFESLLKILVNTCYESKHAFVILHGKAETKGWKSASKPSFTKFDEDSNLRVS